MFYDLAERARTIYQADPFRHKTPRQGRASEDMLVRATSWPELASAAGIDPAIGPLRAAGLRISLLFPGMYLRATADGTQVLSLDEAAEVVRTSLTPQ